MADDIPIYGIDKEIAAKMAGKYDPEREAQAREWLQEVTGLSFPSDDFQQSLKDGVILCKNGRIVRAYIRRYVYALYRAATVVIPSVQIKINSSKIAFKQMENINAFLDALIKLGVPKHETFQTVDLYEGKNIIQVIDCIFAFSRHAVASGFQGPLLGPKLAEKRKLSFTEEQLNQSKSILTLQTSGNIGGANQSGMAFGGRRELGGRDPKNNA